MAGFSSMDDIVSEISSNGKFLRVDWNKNMLPTTAAVAGEWSCLARGGGNPAADSLYNTGSNLTFQAVSDTTSNANGIRNGGSVAPDYKHIVGASSFSAAATSMPSVLMMIDLVGFYRVTSVTTFPAAQSMTNTLGQTSTFTADASTDVITHSNYNLLTGTRVRCTTTTTLPAGLALATDYYLIKVTDTTAKLATSYANAIAGTQINITDAGTGTHTLNWLLPRYTNGAGLEAFIWNTNATAMGAATPNLSIGYTNSEQTGSRATPTVLPAGKTAAANGLILYSGTGAGKYGPFLPKQGGDAGVAQVDTVTLSASYVSGEFSVAICRPLFILPMTTIGVAAERDFLNQLPSLPRVYDGANLVPLIYHGANTPTNSAFYGHLDLIWG